MERRPIGYWLKQLHLLIESTFDRALEADDLTRRHWQVLNSVANGSVSRTQLDTLLAPFLADEPLAGQHAVDDLVVRGWIEDARPLTLTAAGRAGFASVSERTRQVRRTIVAGISDEDYGRTVDILAQMAHNLEPIAS
ncbi:MarR family winged helix-turn-helix transcriptional regulator [Fodinicola feengrottensis]|uniref:MarR family winged helix-turn-helix transcriptional regulator n=1 Tax=Fodinicola feengrottensis TaxID=435914 RepID=A0ABN2GSF5_9ACTN|nr:hypothetical protein [Fodinicola feengrottensis]